MEWREQTSLSCDDAFSEARHWLEEVTRKPFGSNDFRCALENGVLLCDLMNQLKPGLIKRVNRLSTPIAGLDNVNVFLRACGKLGLNEAQLFHPGDLQDLSSRTTVRREEGSRRLKNVLITLYWLGRKAQTDPFYSGPQLNLRAFEGLLGNALSKALEESWGPRAAGVRDSGYEAWFPEKEELQRPAYRREDSADSAVDALDTRTLRVSGEGCGSDTEAEQGFRMANGSSNSNPPTQDPCGRALQPHHRTRAGQEEDRRGGLPLSPLTRSKSLCDITLASGATPYVRQGSEGDIAIAPWAAQGYRQERARVKGKDGEAMAEKWQNALTTWKNRRRTTTSDLRRKMQERETIGQLAIPTETGSLGEQPDRKAQRASGGPAPDPSSSSGQRAVLARSHAVESPCSPQTPGATMPTSRTSASRTPSLGENSHAAPLASDRAGEATTPTPDSPFSSVTQNQAQGLQNLQNLHSQPQNLHSQPQNLHSQPQNLHSQPQNLQNLQSQPQRGPGGEADPAGPRPREEQREQGGAQQGAGLYRYSSRGGAGAARVSATLPRGFRRSEGSARLSVVITAQPFGAKHARVASLPRLFNVEDHKSFLLTEERARPLTPTLTPTAPSHLRQVKGQSWPGPYQEEEEQQEEEEEEEVGWKSTSTHQTSGSRPLGPHLYPQGQSLTLPHAPYPKTQSLAQIQITSKPQSYQQSQAYSPAQAQAQAQAHAGGSPALSGPSPPRPGPEDDYSQVCHSDMRVSLSLKPNSRPDFGFQTHWDSTGATVRAVCPGSPAEQCQLRAGDEIVAVGGAQVSQMTYEQWKASMSSALQAGSLAMDVRRYGNNDWASGGSSQPSKSRKTVNLTAAAPTLIGRPDQYANGRSDTIVSKATAAMRPAPANGQAVNGTGSKSLNSAFHDEPMTSRSRGGSESAISDLQVPSLSPSSSGWSWDLDEERRRQERWQEEQERLLQEKYRRDQERMEAEWQRAQQEAGGAFYRKPEQTNGIASPAASAQSFLSQPKPPTNQKSVPLAARGTEEPVRKEEESETDRAELEEQSDRLTKQEHWSGGSYGFTQLSASARTKSKSTPALHKQETRGAGGREAAGRRGMAQVTVSQVEVERQRILEEMRKRTQLLTDSSWIRQRSASASVHKEPLYTGLPLKRYESLDNLPTTTTSSFSANQGRPHSAAGYTVPSRTAASRYSLGEGLSSWPHTSSTSPTPEGEPAGQSHPSYQQHGRLVSGRRVCCVCDRALGRGAAMVIEALALCFHMACFQCVGCRSTLAGSEGGVQVRVRDRKPYCDRCYLRIKAGSTPSL